MYESKIITPKRTFKLSLRNAYNIKEKSVLIDLYIVVEFGIRIPELAWEVQESVKNSVETMTGLKVEKVNVHIIQCDAAVQKDTKITNQDEFDRYMENLELAGFGGTDFRPVFEYVDKLIAMGEFQNLRGLIYFTDGRGTFPEKMPEYKTAFVYMDNGFYVSAAPAWAIQLVLQEEELE